MIIDYQMEIDDSKQYVATTEKESLNKEDFIPQFRDETHHVRKLFADSKLSSNNFVSTGLCFISVINICFSNIGVKCEKCQRTYQKFITNRVFLTTGMTSQKRSNLFLILITHLIYFVPSNYKKFFLFNTVRILEFSPV
jgi:hypothetical protein